MSGTGTLKGSNPKNSLLRRLRLVALLFGTRVEGRERLRPLHRFTVVGSWPATRVEDVRFRYLQGPERPRIQSGYAIRRSRLWPGLWPTAANQCVLSTVAKEQDRPRFLGLHSSLLPFIRLWIWMPGFAWFFSVQFPRALWLCAIGCRRPQYIFGNGSHLISPPSSLSVSSRKVLLQGARHQVQWSCLRLHCYGGALRQL